MLRFRRYRFFLIFTVIFILAFFHFGPSRDVYPSPKPVSPIVPADSLPKSPTSSVEQSSNPSISLDIPPDSSSDEITNTVSEHATTVTASSTTSSTVESAEIKPTTAHYEIPFVEHSALIQNDLDSAYQKNPPTTRPSPVVRPHWRKMPEHFPISAEDLIRLPSGQPKSLPKLQYNFKDETSTEKSERLQKLATVKEAFQHAWTGYKESAMGHDEIRPVTGGFHDPFAGWGATLVDALDTLWIMDLKEEFAEAVDEVRKIDFTTSERSDIPLFETVIRYLGGLISAYDVSGHKYSILLDKAIELAQILMGAFDTPNRMPIMYYAWAPKYASRLRRASESVVLAELGSLLVEFTRLAQLTKENKYYDAVARISDELEKVQNNTSLPGLWPLHVDASGCKYRDREIEDLTMTKSYISRRRATEPDGHKQDSTHDVKTGLHVDAEPANYKSLSPNRNPISYLSDDCDEQGISSVPYATMDEFGLGAMADSTYEYFPKEYMLLGGLKDQYRTMYEQAMDATRKYLLFRPMTKDNRDILFVAKATSFKHKERLQYEYQGAHLTCFVGGMFGIGAKLFGISGDMDIAKKLTDGCIWAYKSTKTGIMPETFEVLSCKQQDSCVWDEVRYNKTLDPYAESRIELAEKQYQRKLELAKQLQLEKSKQNDESDNLPPSNTSTPTDTHSVNRRELLDEQAVEEGEQVVKMSEDTYGKSSKASEASQQRYGQVFEDTPTVPEFPPTRPSVLSHEGYVENRIKNDRLPSGFTSISGRKYILRPEAIESVFIMFRLTGDNYWREKGWEMFEAIDKHTRTLLAHSAINDVTIESPSHTDSMESFWLAETLKYSYLLFSDPSVISLDEYILNTEAHPFKRPVT
ncbi:hypothetical protein Egran_02245 [Elaphomyces granulatus]|uniref:alpha-1,2-Mannosidase n=1 Tax=Elaphomyces granulatus TaxID=519963 RepID=A0A232M0V4_9EURO|nr:hypothetical protein Egran_02245 [Elaphomyces granulatus]